MSTMFTITPQTPAAPTAARPGPAIAFGDPLLPERFWSKVQIQESGCWEWQAAKHPFGYGAFKVEVGMRRAHRVAYEALVGPIPDGLRVLHDCDNAPCVNPGHLHTGTAAQNTREMLERGRNRNQNTDKTHCPQGHPYDEQNTYKNPRGSRECRECTRERKRRWRRRNIGRKAAGEAA